jgi:hypothetical protein
MNNERTRNYRAISTLNLLKNHGPLPSSALQMMTEPPIMPRKIKGVLARLLNENLISLRPIKFTGRTLRYYQINQAPTILSFLAKTLNCDEHELDQSFFRHREFAHNDGVSILATRLQKLYPDAEIIRDFRLETSEEAKWIMQHSHFQEELKPDLLLRLKNAPVGNDVWIAFELEKTRKDDRRLIRKLRKYAAKTHVDGVVYICDSKYIMDSVKTNYTAYTANWARRISEYKNNFVMFASSHDLCSDQFVNLLRVDGEPAQLIQWISTLCINPMNKRADNMF